ncbi:MAG TPA: NPCBM/NEW2 domain-containing protein [Abditibacteriaceae bacterium]|jgi:tetratricopeptide (TPR) repeat protein
MKFRTLTLAALALCLVIIPKVQAAPDPGARERAIDLVKKAVVAYRKGDPKSAIAYCQAAVAEDEEYAVAYLWIGAARSKLRQRLLAQTAYEAVVLLEPNGSADAKNAISWLRSYSTSRPTTQGTPGGRLMQRIERRLVDRKTVEGRWEQGQNVVIAGRAFDDVGLLDSYQLLGSHFQNKVVFINRCDRLEAWIGKRIGSGGGAHQFQVLGDGKVLYTSPPLGVNDAAIKINVPIKGYRSITLTAQGDELSQRDRSVVWANPTFVKYF